MTHLPHQPVKVSYLSPQSGFAAVRTILTPVLCLAALSTAGLAILVYAGLDLTKAFGQYTASYVPAAISLRKLRLAGLALGGIFLLQLLRRSPTYWCHFFDLVLDLGPCPIWRIVGRNLFYLLPSLVLATLGHATVLYSDLFLTDSLFLSGLCFGMTLWGIILISNPKRLSAPLPERLAGLEQLAATTLALILLLESGLTGLDYYTYTELFLDHSRAQTIFADYRRLLNEKFFGHRFNSAGFYDDEFFVAKPGDFLVACIAGSFGLGIVPQPYNFTSMTEAALQKRLSGRFRRVAVHNFGIPGMGMPEYAFMLRSEVLTYRPSLVVLCVFVGNDLFMFNQHKLRHSFIQNWRLTKLVKHIFGYCKPPQPRITVGQYQAVTLAADSWKAHEANGMTEQEPDYLRDPTIEPPRLSEAEFLIKETERLKLLNSKNHNVRQNYRLFFDALQSIHNRAGEHFLVLLIPDEFQVNDILYSQLLILQPQATTWNRDYPQQHITAFCRDQGIKILDLLPALRQAESTGHTYHLRDTHWNARGNAVATEVLTDYLLTHKPLNPVP
ncbi:putative ALGX domain-containing protein [Desulfovibrionales bacterium]